MKIILETLTDIFLLIPRLFKIPLIHLIEFLFNKINKVEIDRKKSISELKKQKIIDFEYELNYLRKKDKEHSVIGQEIKYLDGLNCKFLGIHNLKTNKNRFNSESKIYDLPEYKNLYFVCNQFETKIQIFAFCSGDLIDNIYSNFAFINLWTFKIDARIISKDGVNFMYLDMLDTRLEYQNIGIATIGINYLKQIALNNKVVSISGKIQYDENDKKKLPYFYKSKGFDIIYSNDNCKVDTFKMKL